MTITVCVAEWVCPTTMLTNRQSATNGRRQQKERIKKCCNPPDSPAVLLSSSGSRFFIRQIAESVTPNLTVLSHNEIPPGNRIVSLGAIT
jgi:flagellar biosynthesis component FlhA